MPLQALYSGLEVLQKSILETDHLRTKWVLQGLSHASKGGEHPVSTNGLVENQAQLREAVIALQASLDLESAHAAANNSASRAKQPVACCAVA